MQSFSTGQKHSFEIDGKPYFLSAIVFGDIDAIMNAQEAADSYQASIDFMRSKMDKRTLEAVNKLSVTDVMELLAGWTGGLMGKSSSSAESEQSTEPPSPQTSETSTESHSGK